jgi:hypothetical protein
MTNNYLIKKNAGNRNTFDIVVTTDEDVINATANNYLPNNNSRYDKEEIGFIPSGSYVQLIANNCMIIAVFNGDYGDISTKNSHFRDGKWNVISNSPYLL